MKLAAAFLSAVLLLAASTRADLTATGNGDCRYGQNDTFYHLEPIAASQISDPIGVATLATCVYSTSIGPIFPYVGTIDLFISATGIGRSRYGALRGRIAFKAAATPDVLQRNPPNPSDTFQDQYFAKFEQAELLLHASDAGDVTSTTLANGSPVTLGISVTEITHLLYAGRPMDLHGNAAESTGSVKVEDATNHTGIHEFSLGNGDVAFDFATTVGAHLLLTLDYTVVAEGRAGRDLQDISLFYPDVEGSIDSAAYLGIAPPADVGFVADSGAQYLPEPDADAAVAVAILSVAALRARRAERRENR
jgi:hypothetical protein